MSTCTAPGVTQSQGARHMKVKVCLEKSIILLDLLKIYATFSGHIGRLSMKTASITGSFLNNMSLMVKHDNNYYFIITEPLQEARLCEEFNLTPTVVLSGWLYYAHLQVSKFSFKGAKLLVQGHTAPTRQR